MIALVLSVGCSAKSSSLDGSSLNSNTDKGFPDMENSQTAAIVPSVDERLVMTVEAVRFPGKEQFLLPENASRFVSELEAVLASDTEELLILADKQHHLAASYAPEDLVSLDSGGASYLTNKSGMFLRRPAELALERLASASRAEGITQVASSAYRSYEYQVGLYERNVRQMGKEAADRESAAPGTSQHQLGTVVDFGSITDEFAETKAGRWLAENAWKYGFSLSFPQGYEEITGYRWECWHFRYVGEKAVLFQRKWFGDIQQYMIEFIDAWRRNEK
ncbi:MAG: M15 family metallopeptidase [Spirochaetaceae bacterium]|nr:M15 family metallopeptidase [Spirochaetaceae bacterium]